MFASNPVITVVLNQYKRRNLLRQLSRIEKQSCRIENVLVVNNSGKSSKEIDAARSRGCSIFDLGANTGYFGRFLCSLYKKSDLVCILDDDMMPGRQCVENYVRQCLKFNAIIGGNGRVAQTNRDLNVRIPRDFGIRRQAMLVDFVGHLWVCRQEWIRNMFEIPPVTFETGEDMHLCFAAKLNLNIPSVVGSQTSISELSDQHLNLHARNRHAGFRLPAHESRVEVEKAFSQLGLEYVTLDEQLAFSAQCKM